MLLVLVLVVVVVVVVVGVVVVVVILQSRVIYVYHSCELDVQFKRFLAVGSGRAGGPCFNLKFRAAMGFRQVTDLSDYSIPELLKLIRCATRVLQQKLSGEANPAQGWSDTDSGVSVIEAGISAAASTADRST